MATLFSTQTNLIIALVSLIVTVPISAGILVLSGKIFKQKVGYVKSLLAAFILGIVSFVIGLPAWFVQNIFILALSGVVSFVVGVALYLTLPRFIHGLEWKSALLVGLVWWVGMIIVSLILAIIIGLALFWQ